MSIKLVMHFSIVVLVWTACSQNISTPSGTALGTPLSPQPAATLSLKLEINACVAGEDAARIRNGPGTDYEVIGALAPGACITIFARNQDSSWAYIATTDNFTGWVAAWLLTVEGDIGKVPVQEDADHFVAGEDSTLQAIPLCANVGNLIGSIVKCKLETAYCVYMPEADASATYCTDKPYPNHFFQFVVAGEDWSEYNGSCMIVTGLLETYLDGQQGALQIIGIDRSQVSSCQ